MTVWEHGYYGWRRFSFIFFLRQHTAHMSSHLTRSSPDYICANYPHKFNHFFNKVTMCHSALCTLNYIVIQCFDHFFNPFLIDKMNSVKFQLKFTYRKSPKPELECLNFALQSSVGFLNADFRIQFPPTQLVFRTKMAAR